MAYSELARRILEQAAKDLLELPEWTHSFSNEYMELVTFFHGPFFDQLCQELNLSPERMRTALHIPAQGHGCRCEWCVPESEVRRLLPDLPESGQELSEFREGWRHAVVWRGSREIMGMRRPYAIIPLRRNYERSE